MLGYQVPQEQLAASYCKCNRPVLQLAICVLLHFATGICLPFGAGRNNLFASAYYLLHALQSADDPNGIYAWVGWVTAAQFCSFVLT